MEDMGPTPNRLAAIRKSLHLTQGAIYAMSHVSPNTIVLIERYGHFPTAETRAKLAKALNVQEEDIWPHLSAVETP